MNTSCGHPNNTFATAIKDKEMRKRAYAAYCQWLAKGKSKKSFYFEEGDCGCTWETLEKYIKESPADFDPEQMKASMAKGYALWEGHVEDSAVGINEKANTASLQMKMRNRFGWDKKDQKTEDEDDNKDTRLGPLGEMFAKYFQKSAKTEAHTEDKESQSQ